jgi:hypothetical protein
MNMLGRYSFQLPGLPGVRARLREPGGRASAAGQGRAP